MTEERFEDLVNLYLDNEISRHELEELKRVIKENLARRKQFERACQLHQAARKALVGGSAAGSKAAAEASRGSGEERSSSRSNNKLTLDQLRQRTMLNATVPTMAERQMTRGVAATVNLSEVSTGRARRSSSSGSSASRAISARGILFLGGLAMAAAGFHFFGPSAASDDGDHYTPDVAAIPPMPTQDNNNAAAAQIRSISDGGEFQPMSTQEVIQQRVEAAAVTGNSVLQPYLVETVSQSKTVQTQNGNTTRQWSMSYNEQLFFDPGNVNVSPPLPEQLKSASGAAPTLQSGTVEAGPALMPAAEGIIVGPDTGAAPDATEAGNNTGGKDLQQ